VSIFHLDCHGWPPYPYKEIDSWLSFSRRLWLMKHAGKFILRAAKEKGLSLRASRDESVCMWGDYGCWLVRG